jgi:hypothetical protein
MAGDDSSATVQFRDTQQFDMRVWDPNDSLVCRWGADQAFAQSLTTRTVAPIESMTFVAHWQPSTPDDYHAMAHPTNTSHGAVAFASVSTP